jgi:hypothetical protein
MKYQVTVRGIAEYHINDYTVEAADIPEAKKKATKEFEKDFKKVTFEYIEIPDVQEIKE